MISCSTSEIVNEVLTTFPLRSVTRQRHPSLALLFNVVLANVITQEKEVTGYNKKKISETVILYT
jgi:hypothetical protein